MLRFLKRWPRLAPRVSESSTEDRAAEGERKLTSGTFCNPDTYPGVGGEALANYVKGVWAAFPDFSIELLNVGEIEPGLVADHWQLRATDVGLEQMEATAQDGLSRLREPPLFRLKEKRFGRTNPVLTGGRWISSLRRADRCEHTEL